MWIPCVVYSSAPSVKITTGRLRHLALPKVIFLDNHQKSRSEELWGPGNGNWFSAALSRQFRIKSNTVSEKKKEQERGMARWKGTIAAPPFRRPPSACSGVFLLLPLVTFTLELQCLKQGKGNWDWTLKWQKSDVTLGQNVIYGGLFIPHPIFINRLIPNGISISSRSSVTATDFTNLNPSSVFFVACYWKLILASIALWFKGEIDIYPNVKKGEWVYRRRSGM